MNAHRLGACYVLLYRLGPLRLALAGLLLRLLAGEALHCADEAVLRRARNAPKGASDPE